MVNPVGLEPVIANAMGSESLSLASRGSPTLVSLRRVFGQFPACAVGPVRKRGDAIAAGLAAGWFRPIAGALVAGRSDADPVSGRPIKIFYAGLQIRTVMVLGNPRAVFRRRVFDVIVVYGRSGVGRFFPLNIQRGGVGAGGNRRGIGCGWRLFHVGDVDGDYACLLVKVDIGGGEVERVFRFYLVVVAHSVLGANLQKAIACPAGNGVEELRVVPTDRPGIGSGLLGSSYGQADIQASRCVLGVG